jgi:hypothetical protein
LVIDLIMAINSSTKTSIMGSGNLERIKLLVFVVLIFLLVTTIQATTIDLFEGEELTVQNITPHVLGEESVFPVIHSSQFFHLITL